MNIFCGNERVRRSVKMNSMTGDEYFQHRRWQLITFLERLSGNWPDQSKLQRYPLQVYHFLILLSIFSALANKLRVNKGDDADMTLECCMLMLVLFSLIFKHISGSIFRCSVSIFTGILTNVNEQIRDRSDPLQRKRIYERIAKDFETMIDQKEAAILNTCAHQGFKNTIIYISAIGLSVGIFDSVPILRSLYNYCVLHGELDDTLPIPMDYGFDHKKYWYIITLDFLLFVCSGFLAHLAFDFSFILQIQHVKGLFKIVGMRVNKASETVSEDVENGKVNDEAADESYSILSSAIDLHSHCLEMVGLIEQTYTYNWSLILLINTGGIGLALHTVVAKLHDSLELFRYTCAYSVVLIHFLIIFSQGQTIIDASAAISDVCYACEWYNLPKKSSKLLATMMLRTSIPCRLTGAKLFPLSMESFSKMLKAGLSYYTVFET